MRTLTRKRLIDRLDSLTGFGHSEVRRTLDMLLATLTEELRSGNRIELRNFGILETYVRAARKARNPKSGETIPVPPKRVARLRPSKGLKAALAAGGKG